MLPRWPGPRLGRVAVAGLVPQGRGLPRGSHWLRLRLLLVIQPLAVDALVVLLRPPRLALLVLLLVISRLRLLPLVVWPALLPVPLPRIPRLFPVITPISH
jgi:hypothetical protein